MSNVRMRFFVYNKELNPAGEATKYFPGKPANVQLNPLRGVVVSKNGVRAAVFYSYDAQGKQQSDSVSAIVLSHSVGLSNGSIAFVNFNPATKLSQRSADDSWIVSALRDVGTPIIVATDVVPPPSRVEKIAAQ